MSGSRVTGVTEVTLADLAGYRLRLSGWAGWARSPHGGGLMPLRLRVTSPVYCGKCGKRRGLAHVCMVRRPDGRTRLKAPSVSLATCPRCGRQYANPFTHVCPPRRGDFKRRKASAAKRAKTAAPKRQAPQHQYQTCRDTDCQRYACVAYRDGYDNGAAAAMTAAAAREGK